MSTQSDTATIEKQKLKEPNKYKVIAHDNDVTHFEEVIFIISRCFDKTEEEALEIAKKVHNCGKGVCGIYTKEIAEVKLETVKMAKEFMINIAPMRRDAILNLKFTLEEE